MGENPRSLALGQVHVRVAEVEFNCSRSVINTETNFVLESAISFDTLKACDENYLGRVIAVNTTELDGTAVVTS